MCQAWVRDRALCMALAYVVLAFRHAPYLSCTFCRLMWSTSICTLRLIVAGVPCLRARGFWC